MKTREEIEGSRVTIDVAQLRRFAEEAGEPWVSSSEFAELLDTYEERERLRAALKRIAFEDELVYLGCADMPFCHDPHTNTKQCPVAVARAALEGRE